MNAELGLIALRQGKVFSGRQAGSTGLSRQERRTLVRRGILRELRRDIFTSGEYWDAADEVERHRIETAGAFLARGWTFEATESPTLAAGHATAGFLHGLPLFAGPRAADRMHTDDGLLPWERRPSRIHLISANRTRRAYVAGIETRPATLPASHVLLDGVVPVTSLARTAVDLMRDGTFDEAVGVADAALRLGVDRAELAAMAEFCRRWPHGSRARGAVLFADGRAESPAESLCRVRLAEDGFVPELQVDFFDAFGHIGRVDLFLRAFGIIVEVDGAVKFLDPWCGSASEAERRQQAREDRLRAAGWIVIRTTWHELRYFPREFMRRVEAAVATSLATR